MSNYPVDLYAQTRGGIQSSAATVVPLLADRFQPATVIDVGCGEGHWAHEFAALGAETTGLDGDHVTPTVDHFVACDLEQPLPDVFKFDIAICLEVAEHLSPGRAGSFVAELCQLAPSVVFSAAIPGQGGAGHLNEQWPGYWTRLFAEHGYPASDALRWQLWAHPLIEPWYRQNLIVFGDLQGLPETEIKPVVHPEIWGWYR
jgi:SAM-dependent methyltransferase